MKYKTIIETDEFEDFKFFEDGIGKYMVGKDAGATADGGWMPLYFTECKQEPILDKLRAEIDTQEKWLSQAGYSAYNTNIAFSAIKRAIAESEE